MTGASGRCRLPLTAPDRLIELVAARLEGLAPGTVAALELLAAGEPLGIALLESMTAPEALEDAERQALIEVGKEACALAGSPGAPDRR